jgi:putative membrane protein
LTNRALKAVLAVLGLLFLAWLVVGWPAGMWGPGAAGRFGMHPMARWMMGYGWAGWRGGAWALAFMFLCWALVIAGAYLVIRWLLAQSRVATRPGQADQALAILRERYARGEVGEEEYDRVRQNLEGGGRP